MTRRSHRLLPVMIVGGASALGCFLGPPYPPMGFDSADGCCIYSGGNAGTGPSERACPDTGVHGDAACDTDCADAYFRGYRSSEDACDGVDNDCDGAIDEDETADQHPDADGDGFGSSAATAERLCPGTPGYVADGTDCNDTNPAVSPAAAETCDGADDDCDGEIDEGCP